MKRLQPPEVIIVYVPGDGFAHMVGANRRKSANWFYSKWSYLPESELNGFLREMLERMHTVIDVRAQANLARAGMGTATPILVVTAGVDLKDATQAAAKLHQALLKTE